MTNTISEQLRFSTIAGMSVRGLLKQRIYQQATGYEDGNDSDYLRSDPMFKLAVGRKPLARTLE